MRVGLIGLGRMRSNLARRLARAGVQIVAFDRSPDARQRLADETGVAVGADSDAPLAQLPAPRIVWLMLPAGDATQQVLDAVVERLSPDDFVDGGNAHYRDSQRRTAALAARGMSLVDSGVSGGVWGCSTATA